MYLIGLGKVYNYGGNSHCTGKKSLPPNFIILKLKLKEKMMGRLTSPPPPPFPKVPLEATKCVADSIYIKV